MHKDLVPVNKNDSQINQISKNKARGMSARDIRNAYSLTSVSTYQVELMSIRIAGNSFVLVLRELERIQTPFFNHNIELIEGRTQTEIEELCNLKVRLVPKKIFLVNICNI